MIFPRYWSATTFLSLAFFVMPSQSVADVPVDSVEAHLAKLQAAAIASSESEAAARLVAAHVAEELTRLGAAPLGERDGIAADRDVVAVLGPSATAGQEVIAFGTRLSSSREGMERIATFLVGAGLLAAAELPRPTLLVAWSGTMPAMLESARAHGETPSIVAYVHLGQVTELDDQRLALRGSETSGVWPRLVEQANVVSGFDLRESSDGADEIEPFLRARIPSLELSATKDGDLNEIRSADDREDLQSLARFASLIVRKLVHSDQAPRFVEAPAGGEREPAAVFTGTIPDYAAQVDGLRLTGVIDGGPAQQAGLRAGDVIVEFAGQPIHSVHDYARVLADVRVGDEISVVFVRDGERGRTTVTPIAR